MVPHAEVVGFDFFERRRAAMAEDEAPDPAQAFAALMSTAAQGAAPAEEAPYGYTTDPATGETRPKKSPGRPRKSPSVDELKAAAAEAPADAAPPVGDRPPADGKHSHWRKSQAKGKAKTPAEPVPQHRPGVITKGVNKLYRRAGKIVTVMDEDIGKALIAITKNTAEEGEPDDSVGAAWDEVARTNPRIRAWLLRVVAGGAWGQLVMAHAPVVLAIFMKDSVQKRVPFVKLLAAMADADEEASPAEKATSLTEPDIQQMMGMARQMAEKMADQMAAGNGRRAPGARHTGTSDQAA
jgi:hypothetical protein